ncbi:MAG: DNA polymerase Y family protein [Acidobacteria bacterium]|nr:DNA polymerase Y family protein [Acidobacteriota bacterium]
MEFRSSAIRQFPMFACLYIPNFPAEALLRADATLLRERPLAVMEGAPPLVHVMAINPPAGSAGIHVGMTRLQAAALETLQMRMRSHREEQAAHSALVDCACAFSPKIEETSSDTVLIEVGGLERVFGDPARIAQMLAQRAASLELHCRVAVAGNPEAAMHAARGFPGITVIPAGEEAQRLGELSLGILLQEPTALSRRPSPDSRAAQELLETFDRWGIRTFHALASLPEVALAERLGRRGIDLQRLARGQSLNDICATEAPLVFEEFLELEYPIETLEPLAFVLNRMLEQLCARLEARALAAIELQLRLELELNPAAGSADPVYALRLPVPMRDARIFLRLLQLELGANPPGAPVAKVLLRAEPALPQPAQHGLFMPLQPQPERLELMLARIAGIVGRDRVGAAFLLDSYHPQAFRLQKFGSTPGPDEPSSARTANGDGKCFAALAQRIFRPPRPAEVKLRNGVPQWVHCVGEQPHGHVTWAAGPWRSSGEWWNPHPGASSVPGAAWQREEWDVEIAGGLYRLVHCDGKHWAVDATYD